MVTLKNYFTILIICINYLLFDAQVLASWERKEIDRGVDNIISYDKYLIYSRNGSLHKLLTDSLLSSNSTTVQGLELDLDLRKNIRSIDDRNKLLYIMKTKKNENLLISCWQNSQNLLLNCQSNSINLDINSTISESNFEIIWNNQKQDRMELESSVDQNVLFEKTCGDNFIFKTDKRTNPSIFNLEMGINNNYLALQKYDIILKEPKDQIMAVFRFKSHTYLILQSKDLTLTRIARRCKKFKSYIDLEIKQGEPAPIRLVHFDDTPGSGFDLTIAYDELKNNQVIDSHLLEYNMTRVHESIDSIAGNDDKCLKTKSSTEFSLIYRYIPLKNFHGVKFIQKQKMTNNEESIFVANQYGLLRKIYDNIEKFISSTINLSKSNNPYARTNRRSLYASSGDFIYALIEEDSGISYLNQVDKRSACGFYETQNQCTIHSKDSLAKCDQCNFIEQNEDQNSTGSFNPKTLLTIKTLDDHFFYGGQTLVLVNGQSCHRKSQDEHLESNTLNCEIGPRVDSFSYKEPGEGSVVLPVYYDYNYNGSRLYGRGECNYQDASSGVNCKLFGVLSSAEEEEEEGNKKEESTFMKELYLYISVSLVAMMIIFLIICFTIIGQRRRKARKSELTIDSQMPKMKYIAWPPGIKPPYSEPSSSGSDGSTNPLLDKSRLPDFLTWLETEKILLERENLEVIQQVGSGQFGVVYRAWLKKSGSEPIEVCAKTLINTNDIKEKNGLLEEGLMMRNFEHENVLPLIGVAFEKETPIIVTPYMKNSDLRTYIITNESKLSLKNLIEFGLQIAKGMDYLSNKKFVHRDLAARNCMLSAELSVKVADFGLSRDIYSIYYYDAGKTKRPRPIRWMSIESIDRDIYNSATDVWSFGVVLWELVTFGCTPYSDVEDNFSNRLKCGLRLLKPEICPKSLYKIMLDCWKEAPENRPTFSELVDQLSKMIK